MTNKLLAIGDSFTWGAELDFETTIYNAWPYLVAKKLNWEVNNLAANGASNTTIVRCLMEQNLDEYSAVAIAWTHYDRYEFADEHGTWTLWPTSCQTKYKPPGTPHRQIMLDYIGRHFNDDYQYFSYLSQIVLVQSYLKCHNKPYIMMDTFGNDKYEYRYSKENEHLHCQVDKEKFLGWPSETMVDWCVAEKVKFGRGGHFLDEGHEVVANKVLKTLQQIYGI